MRATEKSASSLPARQEVLRWQKELDRLKAEEVAMKTRHAAEEKAIRDRRTKLEKLVQYGMALADMDVLPEEHPHADEPQKPTATADRPKQKGQPIRGRRQSNKTWTATIKRIITTADRGMTHAEVKKEVADTHLGETLLRTEKAFYGAIGKLNERGDIIKHKGLLFSPKAFQQFMEDVAAGRIEDLPAAALSSRGESPNEVAIERFLRTRPNGATTREIVDSLLNDPPADLAVTTNKNSIYNLLARLRDRGKLIKRGDRYFLPRSEGEAPDSSEPSASQNKGDRGGALSSSGSQGNGHSLTAFPGASPAHPGV